jgi:hypothetical protein
VLETNDYNSNIKNIVWRSVLSEKG